MSFFQYKPPKTIRALFIIHYAPLLLIIMIGPQSVYYQTFLLPLPALYTIVPGMIIFILGAIFYFKWEYFWYHNYQGQLVTDGIFSHIRHPHYTTLIIIGYGLALFFNSLLSLIIATIAIPIMMISIIDEEKHLLKQYGIQYESFMKRTPWRMIPKLF
jgi:protein-S-isoprenylcysteine O-methyltransferase Ste14